MAFLPAVRPSPSQRLGAIENRAQLFQLLYRIILSVQGGVIGALALIFLTFLEVAPPSPMA
jgi:hypothetical protein